MKGNAVMIIREAMDLGVYCRPVPGSNPFGSQTGLYEGEALRPCEEWFERVEAWSDNYNGIFVIKPGHLLLDWELITREKLVKEYEKHVESMTRSPF